jgi:serine/threonine protein kinase
MSTPTSQVTSLQNGRYKLVGELGVGGMAVVYLGYDTMLKVRRAVKVLNAAFCQNNKVRTRFLQEAQTMARLRHRNIVTVFDVGMDGNTPFIVMELLEGGSFHHYTERMGSFSPPLAARLMRGMLKGLQEAHDNKVVHRDIKPHNILLGMDGRAKLTDFGIAQVTDTDHSMTKTGSILGTLAYMSPEQRMDAKSADHTADIYASGATLYALVKSIQPFDLYATEFHKKVFVGVPDDCAAVIKKACEFEKSDRYQSPMEMADALNPLAEELTDEEWETFLSHLQTPKEQKGTMAWEPDEESLGDDVSQTFHFDVAAGRGDAAGGSQDSLALGASDLSNADMPDFVATKSSKMPLVAGLFILVALGGGAFVFLGGDSVPEVSGEETTNSAQVDVPDATADSKPETQVEEVQEVQEAVAEKVPDRVAEPEEVKVAPAIKAAPAQKPALKPVAKPEAKPAAEPKKPEPVVAPEPEPVPEPTPPKAARAVVHAPVSAMINTLPAGTIFIDGVAKGPTWFQGSIQPGTHKLTMKANDGRTATTNITVRPNKTFRFCWSFDAGGPCPR